MIAAFVKIPVFVLALGITSHNPIHTEVVLSVAVTSRPTCSVCTKAGDRYRVWEAYRTRTLMGISPGYWDEDGKYHDPVDPNWDTIEYRCSNGHSWSVEER